MFQNQQVKEQISRVTTVYSIGIIYRMTIDKAWQMAMPKTPLLGTAFENTIYTYNNFNFVLKITSYRYRN